MSFPKPSAEWRMPDRHVGRRVLYFDEVTSTNDIARTFLDEPGTAIVASSQSKGRGQFGNVWHCPPNAGVLLSVVLDPPENARRPAILTAWAAVAAADAVRFACGEQARIKWPNDLLIRGQKVCGILIEQSRGVIAGIGLNVNQTEAEFEQLGLPSATSLAIVAGRPFDCRKIAQDLLEQLDSVYQMMINGDLSTLEAIWKWRVGLLGRDVMLKTHDGRSIEGRLKEMGFEGFELETTEGLMTERPECVKALTFGERGQ